jgi:hypothetical protein
MRRWLWIAGLVAATWTSPAAALEPTGFTHFPWGTPREVVAQGLGSDTCSRRIAIDTVRGKSLLCYDYRLDGVGPVILTLEFTDEGLQGFGFTASRGQTLTLKALVRERLGQPGATAMSGGVLAWDWPSGNRALFDEHCVAGDHACLSVRTGKILHAGLYAVEPRRR